MSDSKTIRDMKNTEIRISLLDLDKLGSNLTADLPYSITVKEMRETVISVSEWELTLSVPEKWQHKLAQRLGY